MSRPYDTIKKVTLLREEEDLDMAKTYVFRYMYCFILLPHVRTELEMMQIYSNCTLFITKVVLNDMDDIIISEVIRYVDLGDHWSETNMGAGAKSYLKIYKVLGKVSKCILQARDYCKQAVY